MSSTILQFCDLTVSTLTSLEALTVFAASCFTQASGSSVNGNAIWAVAQREVALRTYFMNSQLSVQVDAVQALRFKAGF